MAAWSDYYRWALECRPVSSRGSCLTFGDIVHRGYQDYYAPRPCPNGLPHDPRAPLETEWGRERHEKRKREIESYRQSALRDELAGQLTDDDILKAIGRIIEWEQQSQIHNLQQPVILTGS